MVTIINQAVSGRVRFKVLGLYRSEPLKNYLESKLSLLNGIEEVRPSILTGNILVFFNSTNSPQCIAVHIERLVVEYQQDEHIQAEYGQEHRKQNKPASKKEASLPVSHREFSKDLVQYQKQTGPDWHMMDEKSVEVRMKSSRSLGLSFAEVKKRLKKYGANLLPDSEPRSGWSMFFDQFKSLPVALLTGASILSVATGGIFDSIAIMSVVTINAVIGYLTESKAEKTIHSLKNVVRPVALALREGNVIEIHSEDVVPGDIVILRPGIYVTADARIIESQNLNVDESALTGESMPVVKNPKAITHKNTPLADRHNMVYMGTLITGGQGVAMVVATGQYTQMGQIQALVGDVKPPDTPMERQLDQIGNQLVYICSAVCGLVFLVGLFRGYGLLQMLKIAISLAVAAVPEGLPTVATTILAMGIQKMKEHKVLIRHLNAVETLGSVQTLCFDKTGTITLNKMSVVHVYMPGQSFGVEYINNSELPEEFLTLVKVCALCNESEITFHEKGNYVINGSSTENALVELALSGGIDVVELRKSNPLVRVNHRSDNRNFMVTYHKKADKGQFIAVKGSPSEVLSLCHWQLKDGQKLPITDDDRREFQAENERMAGEALRILGIAYRKTPEDKKTDGFIWLGLVGMADPIRSGVKGLMRLFHRAGMDTVMITGDQSPTAYAIGKTLGLSNGNQLEILDSSHLDELESSVFQALAQKAHVFSRVSPSHKLQIVQALQGAGKVIAMTGDGINDAPALKAADIGIAMGHTGTDVAREVADIVLEDDNLQTMIIAVSHGRTIYSNIRKSIHYLLSTNMSEIMVSFATIAAGAGHPLNAMQLLWINLLSDIWPGLALSMEPSEPDVLSQPPRDPDEPIITRAGLKRMTFESAMLTGGAMAAFGYGVSRYGLSPRSGTLMFSTLTIGQLIHAISCRSDKYSIFDKEKLPPNRHLTFALGASLALQVLAMGASPIRRFLGLTPINIIDGLVIGAGALIPLLINEKTKKKEAEKNIIYIENNTL